MAPAGWSHIAKRKTKGKVKGLLQALHDAPDPTVRQAAAKALGRIAARSQDPARRTSAIEGLVAALRDADRIVGKTATRQLGRVGAPAVKPLLSALERTDKSSRKAALKAIRKIGPGALRPLGSVLKSGDKGMRKTALWILKRL
jgi:hypothetical protein